MDSFEIESNFYIVKDKKEKSSIIDLKNKSLLYSENLENVKKATCLLEIVVEGQTGLTLRTMEALFFNKKLITNNSSIMQYDFYHPNNILIIRDEADIDLDFFLKPFINRDEYLEKYKIGTWLENLVRKNNLEEQK